MRDPHARSGEFLSLALPNGQKTAVACKPQDIVESLVSSFTSIAKVTVRYLMYDGERLSPTQTLEQAGLCDRSEIDVVLSDDEQTGGGALSPKAQAFLSRCHNDPDFLSQVMRQCSAPAPTNRAEIRSRVKELEDMAKDFKAEAERLKAKLGEGEGEGEGEEEGEGENQQALS